jgi:broad specificity phosphatase PhoE
MKKYLILVKHSLPGIVENLPAREWKLSDEGRIRAQQLAERLIPFQPEVIISSVEPKARETAEFVAGRHKLALQIADGLHEHDRSKTPYLSKDEFQAAMHEFFEKPETLVLGIETADQAYARFYLAVHSVRLRHPNETVVIVAHGTVISLFVSRLTGIAGWSLWNELGLPSYVMLDHQLRTIVARENII